MLSSHYLCVLTTAIHATIAQWAFHNVSSEIACVICSWASKTACKLLKAAGSRVASICCGAVSVLDRGQLLSLRNKIASCGIRPSGSRLGLRQKLNERRLQITARMMSAGNHDSVVANTNCDNATALCPLQTSKEQKRFLVLQ